MKPTKKTPTLTTKPKLPKNWGKINMVGEPISIDVAEELRSLTKGKVKIKRVISPMKAEICIKPFKRSAQAWRALAAASANRAHIMHMIFADEPMNNEEIEKVIKLIEKELKRIKKDWK